MQADIQFRPPPPPNRADTYSPSSTAGSDWSGMNNYNNGGLRPDAFQQPPARGDSMSPPEFDGGFGPPHRAQTFAAGSPTEGGGGRAISSENGSRASSRAGSSRNSDMSLRDPRSHRYQRAESELRQHYAVLRAYLKGGAAQPPRTNKARDKLLRLSPVQFHELSTDVFDELQRRQAAQPIPGRPPRQDKVPPFLQPRPDFHEKRNQARQKLSSLQTSRFRDLSTDVFCELERRFPHFNPENKMDHARSQSRGPPGRGQNGFGPPPRAHTTQMSMSSNAGFPPRKASVAQIDVNSSNEYGRPMPKQFQSNTITPNKSTMVEDEDDEDGGPMGRYDRSSDAFGLESSLTSPRSNRDTSATSMTGGSRDAKSLYPPSDEMHHKVTDLEQKLDAKDSEIRSLRDELQQKLDQAENLNQSMREEIERMRQEHASQMTTAAGDSAWRGKHDELEKQHKTLKSKYDQQLKTTEEVSKQFKAHMADMRAMADETSGGMQREEQLHTEVQRLREESAEWKARYTKAKTALKTVRVSTIGLNAGGSKALKDQTFYSTDGIISELHVTKFQVAIDELLGGARDKEPSAVLDHIRDLVVAVRSITGDIDRATEEKNDELARKRNKLKAKVSATANNTITASKNYAAAQGLSPVSLLDAAASHLSASVIDLIRNVKIRPSTSAELSEDNDPHMTPVNKNGYFNVADTMRRSSGADSIYSALSDPAEPDPRTPVAPSRDSHVNGNGYGLGIHAAHLREDDVELEELKIYIGNQTDVLVQNIQALVGAVRSEDNMPAVRNHANSILDVVDMILAAAEGGMQQPSSFQSSFAHHISATSDQLMTCKDSLETAVQTSVQHDGKASARDFIQTLPPLAFQIAREAKDLVARMENVSTGGGEGGEDFS